MSELSDKQNKQKKYKET